MILFTFLFSPFRFLFQDPEPLSIATMEESELPKLVIVGIALAGLGLLVVNAVLVACFIIRRRNKGTLFAFIYVHSHSQPLTTRPTPSEYVLYPIIRNKE